jgi:hypothetical protein
MKAHYSVGDLVRVDPAGLVGADLVGDFRIVRMHEDGDGSGSRRYRVRSVAYTQERMVPESMLTAVDAQPRTDSERVFGPNLA